jgi:peroxiredoxin Q/BCP
MTESASPTIPAAGEPAPDFALPDDAGGTVRLADLRGSWVVLYFYPKDDTPGCTTEACQFRDLQDPLVEAGARVVGVSPDGAASHRRFREKYGLAFTLLSDVDHQAAERYGAWQLRSQYGRSYWGIQRSTFLIDPDGLIARAWPRVRADGHAAEVLEALAAARAAS